MNILHLGSGAELVVAMIFNIVALTTPAWWQTGDITYQGLYKGKVGSTELELIMGRTEKVTLAFNVMASVSLLVASALMFAAARKEGHEKTQKIGGGIAILAAILILIAMSTYTGYYKEAVDSLPINRWGYSYICGWIAFCLSLVGGVTAFNG